MDKILLELFPFKINNSKAMGKSKKQKKPTSGSKEVKLINTGGSGKIFKDNSVPDELEKSWVNYVTAFEEAEKNKKLIKLFDKIGRPAFKLKVDDKELPGELEKLLVHLYHYNVGIDSISELSDRELYRFIVEDLFQEEVIDIPFNLAFTCFTYEDFYPNHPYDISQRLNEFIEVVKNKELTSYSWVFSLSFKSVTGLPQNEVQVRKKLNAFLSKYQCIEIPFLEPGELSINLNEATQKLGIRMEGTTSGNKVEVLEGTGYINFNNELGWWGISGISMPGFEI